MSNFLLPPWEHQLNAINHALSQRDFAFFCDMGTGKTAMAINTLRFRFAQYGKIMRTLIVCPIVVANNWKREFKMHSKIPQEKIITLIGTGKQRVETMKKVLQDPRVIIITNFEALRMRELYPYLQRFLPEIMVVDESQRIKTPGAKTTQKTWWLGQNAKHRYILSGTPILNSGLDIYSQFRFLDNGETFGRSYVEFKNRYFYDANIGMPKETHFEDWQPRPGAYDTFNDLIYRKAVRVLKKDCMTLPPLVRKRISVELTKDQLRNYKQMHKDFVAYLQDAACVANLALTKGLRLAQIVSGFFRDTEEGERYISYDDNPRLKALEELLEMLIDEHKVIVWACFKENYNQIEDLFIRKFGGEKNPDVGAVKLVGGMTDKARQHAIDEFQNNPKIRVMIANQAAGGVGVNLTAASYAIYYSRNFSLEADLQSEARNYRGGSDIHEKVTRIDLVAEGTIDEIILDSLLKKENMANDILKYKERFL